MSVHACFLRAALAVSIVTSRILALGESGTRDIFDYGTGAGALAMGNAYVSVARGVEGLTWNPASLDLAGRTTLESMVSLLPFGGIYSHVGLALPIYGAGTAGLAVSAVSLDQVTGYTEDFIPGNAFHYLRLRVIGGYGQSLGHLPLQIGITLRMDYSDTADFQATYVNADFGVRSSLLEWLPGQRGLKRTEWVLGIATRNLLAFSGPKLNLEADIEPVTLSVGTMFSHSLHPSLGVKVSADLTLDTLSNVGAQFGLELKLFRFLDLRGGWILGQGPSAGAGMHLEDLDVSYAAIFRNAVVSHNVGVSWAFGESRDARSYRLAAEERDAIDSVVLRNIEEEKERLSKVYREVQERALEELRKKREAAEREQAALIQAKENALTLSMESNRLAMEQMVLSNTLMMESMRLSNDLWAETVRRSNEAIVLELSQSNQTLASAMSKSNQEWKQALDISNQKWSETLQTTKQAVLVSNQMLLAQATRSNELAMQALMKANALARETLNNQAKENVNRLNRQIAENQARQKNLEGMYNSALTAFNTGNGEDALVQFKKILELDPGNQEVLAFIKKIEDAKRPVENYSAEEVELYREGMKHFLKKDYAKAIEVWEGLLKRYPYNNLAIQGVEKAKKRLKGN